MVRREPRINTNAAQRGARTVRRERRVVGVGSVVAIHAMPHRASSCVSRPVDVRCADRDA
ncbi:hypothetical protein DID96_14145 [Burkholderia sp. Bp8963]|nr:hypothetical protein DID96_14145 [Burkholderia sp. Bp8963]